MEALVTPSKLNGTVKAIASKSCAHRLLICAALSDAKTTVECAEGSEDIEATIRCLTALGAKIERTRSGFDVTPLDRTQVPKHAVLDCGESGSTLRFLLPVACALGAGAVFKMGGRLPQRPMTALCDALSAHGCAFHAAGDTLEASGTLMGGAFSLPGNVSSQYVSGLLFALPLTEAGGTITLTGEIESKNYISMTVDALSRFGVAVNTTDSGFKVSAGGVKSPKCVSVEGDWSNAAFWLCAAAMGAGKIECTGLNFSSLQGDREIISVLSRFGASVETCGDAAIVAPAALCGCDVDARNIPDLVPAIAAMAAVAEGETVIKNAARLRIKESDRLRSVSETLNALGADIRETEDGLVIHGKTTLRGGDIDACKDHRIAMMAAIAAVRCENPVRIQGAEAVRKSYPAFFDDFVSLGGNVRKED